MDKVNQQIETLTAKMQIANRQISERKERLADEQIELFDSVKGCINCRGRGWVVTWDTLDSMSGCFAEYGSCPKCEGKGRLTDGPSIFYPENNKYDKYRNSIWIVDDETVKKLITEKNKIKSKLGKAEALTKIGPGCIVKATKASRAKGALPEGLEAKVIKKCNSQYDTKWFVVGSDGVNYFPMEKYLEVTVPAGNANVWQTEFEKEASAQPTRTGPDISKGCIVKTTVKSNSNGALPIGVEGKVAKLCNSKVKKWFVVTEDGEKFFPLDNTLEVVHTAGSPEVWKTPWEKSKKSQPQQRRWSPSHTRL